MMARSCSSCLCVLSVLSIILLVNIIETQRGPLKYLYLAFYVSLIALFIVEEYICQGWGYNNCFFVLSYLTNFYGTMLILVTFLFWQILKPTTAILLHVIFVSFTVCFIGLHTKRLMIEMESRQQLASEIHVEAAAGEVAALDRDNRNGGNDDGDGLHGGNGNGGDGNGADELMVGRIDHNRAREYWRRIQGQYLARTSEDSQLAGNRVMRISRRERRRRDRAAAEDRNLEGNTNVFRLSGQVYSFRKEENSTNIKNNYGASSNGSCESGDANNHDHNNNNDDNNAYQNFTVPPSLYTANHHSSASLNPDDPNTAASTADPDLITATHASSIERHIHRELDHRIADVEAMLGLDEDTLNDDNDDDGEKDITHDTVNDRKGVFVGTAFGGDVMMDSAQDIELHSTATAACAAGDHYTDGALKERENKVKEQTESHGIVISIHETPTTAGVHVDTGRDQGHFLSPGSRRNTSNINDISFEQRTALEDESNDSICCICLDEFVRYGFAEFEPLTDFTSDVLVSNLTWQLPCGHLYHYGCILKYSVEYNKDECPCCRAKFKVF